MRIPSVHKVVIGIMVHVDVFSLKELCQIFFFKFGASFIRFYLFESCLKNLHTLLHHFYLVKELSIMLLFFPQLFMGPSKLVQIVVFLALRKVVEFDLGLKMGHLIQSFLVALLEEVIVVRLALIVRL